MNYTSGQWDGRLERVVEVLLWLTLALGIFMTFFQLGTDPRAYAAVGICGVYVAIVTVLPKALARRRLVREVVIVVGSISTMSAVGMTGSLSSPFLLLALMPVLYAAVFGGFRAGIGSAALSAGILTSLVLPLANPSWAELTRWIVLLLLVAVTFGYANRLLLQEGDRFSALAAVTAETSLRLERLDTANRLLVKLAQQAESAELNPIEVGSAALESVRRVVPFAAGNIAIASEAGPVVVSSAGEGTSSLPKTSVPLLVGEREVGSITVATEIPLTKRQEETLRTTLQPAAIAFSNVLLLQSIARTAIREERTRLARDLHDEIGPSLASLGLALDLAGLQHHTEPALAGHLQELRNEVTTLVENVRSSVSDLRTIDQIPSIREVVFTLIREREGDKPAILFELLEHHQPRPSIAADVNSIVIEAVRNAIRHSEASTVTIRGLVDFGSGSIEIADNGKGFDASGTRTGHYGIVGIRQRAAKIGARAEIYSDPSGTVVSVQWGGK